MSTKKLQILTPIVTSVNGETGDVTIDMNKTAVGLDKVDNTSDADKPISTATKTALDGKQDKITAKGLLRGDGTGNIAAVDGSFLAYEPIADVEATTPIDADTLNGKTYDYINSTKQDKLTAGDNISIDNNVVSTKVYPCNPNLLDNWYFGNPVNQQGQASYSGIGYGIDRWKANAATPNVTTIKDGYIELSQNALIEHVLEEPYSLCEKQVAASVLLTTRLYTFTATIPSKEELSAVTEDKVLGNTYFVVNGKGVGYIDLLHTKAHRTILRLRAFEGYTVGAIAAKLELGGVQTLAHQDEDGNWVLNEIPDYGEQLRRCRRYFYRRHLDGQYLGFGYGMAFTSSRLRMYIPLPVTMRTGPSVTAWSAGENDMEAISTNPGTPNTFSLSSCTYMPWPDPDTACIEFAASGLTQGSMYQIRTGGTSMQRYIDFSAEL